MDKLKLKNLLLTRIGRSYGFLVGKGIVETLDLLEKGQRYDVDVIIKDKTETLKNESETSKDKAMPM